MHNWITGFDTNFVICAILARLGQGCEAMNCFTHHSPYTLAGSKLSSRRVLADIYTTPFVAVSNSPPFVSQWQRTADPYLRAVSGRTRG
ncbi:hypothetical protein BKA93DRAFT_346383 [Sparassis latifolia]